MKNLKQRKAFTVVEMVIVIAVIAILATVLIPTISGVIQKANHSTDMQFAASLNIQLALWEVDNGAIENESDLRDAINEYYGAKDENGELLRDDQGNLTPEADYYSTLSPKSGKYGYHFWYDVENRQVVVEKYEDLLPDPADPAAVAEEPKTFSPASPRSLEIGGKTYFLMDQAGDEVVSLFVALENLGDDTKVGAGSNDPAQQYEYIVNKLYENATEGTLEALLLAKVQTTTIVTGQGAYRFSDVDAITHIYVPMYAEIINVQKIFVYTPGVDGAAGSADGGTRPSSTCQLANSENVNKVEIPLGVKIASNGFPAMATGVPEDYSGATVLYIPANNLSELTDAEGNFMFDVQTCEPVFELANGAKYVMLYDKVYSLPYKEGNESVEIGGNVGTGTSENLDVEVFFPDAGTEPGGTHYYDGQNNILYVQYDLPNVAIEVSNGKYVEWSYELVKLEEPESTDLVTISGATLSINRKIGVDENNQILVKGKINGVEKVSFTVCLVRPTKVTFGELNSVLHSVGAVGEKSYELVYDGKSSIFAAITVKVDYSINEKVSPWDVTFKSESGKFTVAKNYIKNSDNEDVWDGTVTITLGSDYTFTDILTITVGDEAMAVQFKIEGIDRSSADFSVKPIVDINGDGKLTYIDTDDDGVADTLLDTPMGSDYLFRVGNSNGFAVKNIFYNLDESAETVRLEIIDITADASGNSPINSSNKFTAKVNSSSGTNGTWDLNKANWESATIDFDGTGIAKIKIGNVVNDVYKVSAELVVEVVYGKNVVTYSDLTSGNCVLLNDITMTSGSTHAFSDATLYGNGFTFNVANGDDSTSQFAVLHATNTTIDNVKVIGATYTAYSGSTGADYANSSAVFYFAGTSEIVNSYVYGCRAPIRLQGDELTIKNTVLEGGNYANIDLRKGNLILDNVVTINTAGLGIVVDSGAATVSITGTLKQYNWMCNADKSKVPSSYQSVFGEMFQNDNYIHSYGGTDYVNTGILLLNEYSNTVNVSGYAPFNVSYMSYTRQVVTLPNATYDLVASDLLYRDSSNEYPYERDQGNTKPTYSWTNPKVYDSTTGSWIDAEEYDSTKKKITLSVNEGESVDLNPHFLKATKYGESLDVSVSMNGTTYAGNISFSENGTYELVYTITDDVIFDETGTRVTMDKYPTYTKTVTVQVNVIRKVGAPTFTFYYGTNGKNGGQPYTSQPSNTVAGTIIPINGVNYMSAGTAGGTNIGSTKVGDQIVYYPIVDGINVRSGSAADYDYQRYYPIFKAVTIADNGTNYSYSTATMPGTLEWVKVVSGGDGNGNGSIVSTVDVYSNRLCRFTNGAGNAESGGTTLVQFQYTAQNGQKYVYYVQYNFYNEDEIGSCVTPDTLVTLADGTQKEIQYVTYKDQLLVWNFYTGKYDVMPASIVQNHGYAYNTVATLKFSDGTTVNTINGHGFFDVAEKKYVIISENNAAEHVGHEFIKVDGDGYSTVTLEDFSISTQYVESWSILTAVHFNCILENMWTLTPAEVDGSPDYLMPFEIGEDMKYDEAKMQADIEKYGLYTYEDFAEYCTYEQFVGFGFANFKVSVEKGYITWAEIEFLLDLHLGGTK